MLEVLLVLLVLSLIGNAVFGYRQYKKKNVLTTDAQKLLSEILSGTAVVKIEVIDPTGLFYRSPRG